ncbi:MAG: hypothetical protein WAV28_15785 [Sedimentisphaerales bacterium]
MMKWIIAAIAVEAVVEILIHSELFAWLRRLNIPLFNCAWCLSVWVATGAFILLLLGLWWLMIPLVISRMSNLFHEIFARVRG